MTTHLTAQTAPARYRIDISVGGHALVADEPAALGGADTGPSPFAHVLAGLAACTGITLRMYAEHKGWPAIALSIALDLDVTRDSRGVRRRVVVAGAPDPAALDRLRDVVERHPGDTGVEARVRDRHRTGGPMNRRVLIAAAVAAALAAFAPTAALAQAPALQSIVVLPTDLQDDHENPDTVEAQKKRLIDAQARIAEQLAARGLYRVLDLSPAQTVVDQSLATQAFLYKCTDCARRIGQAAGADLVMVTWVQKVSELILNMNVEVLRVSDGRSLLTRSVDMRGNTDVAWDRGARYLVKQLADDRAGVR